MRGGSGLGLLGLGVFGGGGGGALAGAGAWAGAVGAGSGGGLGGGRGGGGVDEGAAGGVHHRDKAFEVLRRRGRLVERGRRPEVGPAGLLRALGDDGDRAGRRQLRHVRLVLRRLLGLLGAAALLVGGDGGLAGLAVGGGLREEEGGDGVLLVRVVGEGVGEELPLLLQLAGPALALGFLTDWRCGESPTWTLTRSNNARMAGSAMESVLNTVTSVRPVASAADTA